jgi:hypothetical protein
MTIGKCVACNAVTASSGYKLCPKCSAASKQCEAYRASLATASSQSVPPVTQSVPPVVPPIASPDVPPVAPPDTPPATPKAPLP